MNRKQDIKTGLLVLVAAGITVLGVGRAHTHCDSTRGPLIPEAKAALEKGDVTPLLKWVTVENEPEIETAFAKATTVRAQGAAAKELADRYFIETLVRLHRAGEGAPYTGIKDEPVDPIVAMADAALAGGSADKMIQALHDHMAGAIRERFAHVLEAKRNKDKSVEAGREFVEGYVTYVHYVEAVHAAMASAGAHHAEAAPGAGQHEH